MKLARTPRLIGRWLAWDCASQRQPARTPRRKRSHALELNRPQRGRPYKRPDSSTTSWIFSAQSSPGALPDRARDLFASARARDGRNRWVDSFRPPALAKNLTVPRPRWKTGRWHRQPVIRRGLQQVVLEPNSRNAIRLHAPPGGPDPNFRLWGAAAKRPWNCSVRDSGAKGNRAEERNWPHLFEALLAGEGSGERPLERTRASVSPSPTGSSSCTA